MLTKRDWEEIIYKKDGSINKGQVIKELRDYGFLLEQASKVYHEICGLSKTNYKAEQIITELNDRYYSKEFLQYDLKQVINRCDTYDELSRELKKHFDIK